MRGFVESNMAESSSHVNDFGKETKALEGEGLDKLNAYLETLFKSDTNLKLSAFKKFVREQGICLKNMQAYGSTLKLRRAMRKNRNLMVRKDETRGLKYVKLCLIQMNGPI